MSDEPRDFELMEMDDATFTTHYNSFLDQAENGMSEGEFYKHVHKRECVGKMEDLLLRKNV